MERKRNWIVIALVGLWVAFTVTLAGWWLIFGLRQLNLINQSNLEGAVQLHRHYQMLLWEGGILIVSLIGRVSAWISYTPREQKPFAHVEKIFAGPPTIRPEEHTSERQSRQYRASRPSD